VLAPRLPALLALRDPALKALAIEVMIAHDLRPEPAAGAAIVADASAPAELRAQALRLVLAGKPDDPAAKRSLDAALREESPAPLHRAALASLLPSAPDRLVAEAGTVLARRTLSEKQHAVALLARAGTPAADDRLAALGTELVAGKSEPGLALDILEALEARSTANPALAAKLAEWTKRADAPARPELLAGGDVARGRDLVANHLGANCTACHVVETSGGSEVGPSLRAIGAQRDAAYLLESLLNPSAQIATGYGLVAVKLKDGTEISGTLARETPAAVTVRMFDGKQRILPRAEIATQSVPVSVMPPMLGILQPREIRDVVTYLASLKGGRPPRKRDTGGD
jgi:putative heme-binding domain-containing protein